MLRRDQNTRDLGHEKLQLCDDVLVWPVHECGELVYRFEIPSLHRFYRVGYAEYVLISLLDGKTTLPQACGLSAAKLGPNAPTAAQANAIARWLITNELAHVVTQRPPLRDPHTARPSRESSLSVSQTIFHRFNPFWMKVPVPKADKWLQGTARKLSPLLSSTAVICGLILMLVAGMQFLRYGPEFIASSGETFHSSNWMQLLVTWISLKLLHELGHAVACARTGSEVHDGGLIFVLFAPLAYVDVTSCWRLSSRWSRLLVSAAGIYVELVIAAFAFLLWTHVSDVQTQHLLYNVVIMAGVSTFLFNANALMRFDGYYILADLIEIPNLYSEGMAAVMRVAKRVVLGQHVEKSRLDGWRARFVLAYGVAAVLWRILVCLSLAIAASVMFSGGGIALAVLGIWIWVSGPIIHLVGNAVELSRIDLARFLRGVIISSVALTLGYFVLFRCPFPTSIRVPAVVQHRPESIVRCRSNGFVSTVHVENGSTVRKGDLLLEINNDELSNQISQLEVRMQKFEARIKRAKNEHDAAKEYVLRQSLMAVKERRQNLKRQSQGLRLTAPSDGIVIARNLDAITGTYLNEGDAILVIGDLRSKEVIALVGQRLVDDVRSQVPSPVTIRTAAFVRAGGNLERVEPRATDDLTFRSLAATEGGQLPVRESFNEGDGSTLSLVEPCFHARIQADPTAAESLVAGMRAEVYIGYQTTPIAIRARESIASLWYSAKREATQRR